MNRDSLRLAAAGALIGVLALSATVTARRSPPAEAPPGGLEEAAVAAMATLGTGAATTAEPTETQTEPPEEDPTAEPFRVALRIPDPIPGERLFLCDALGCPLEAVTADRDGDAVLGPLRPGRYGLWRGETQVGSFRLGRDAALEDAEGRLWTDGEVLWLERWATGTARLRVTLTRPGYYTLQLCDRDGRTWRGDVYVAEDAAPDGEGRWLREVEFRGLAPGLYTAVRRNSPLGQLEVRAGEITEAAVRIEN